MAEQIISASGTQYGLVITPEGAIPISGVISVTSTTGSESYIKGGSIQTFNPIGIGSVRIAEWGVNGIVSTNLGSTYTTTQIIRNLAGSPAGFFVFGGVSRNVMFENLGSNLVYFNFDAEANPVGSGTGIIFPRDVISLDAHIGSISFQSSGTTSSAIQVINIR